MIDETIILGIDGGGVRSDVLLPIQMETSWVLVLGDLLISFLQKEIG